MENEAAVRMPDGVFWVRCNALSGLLCLSAAFSFICLTAVGVSALSIGLALAIAVVQLLIYGVPAWAPRRRWAFAWTAVELVLTVFSLWWSIPAIIAAWGLTRAESRAWYRGTELGTTESSPVLRYGVAAFIVIYWVVTAGGLTASAHQSFHHQPKIMVTDGGPHLVIDGPDGPVANDVSGPATLVGTTIDGQPWNLDDIDGPVTLVLWASWCGDCDREMGQLGRSVIGVRGPIFAVATDCDDHGDNAAVRAKMEAAHLGWPVICAVEGSLVDQVAEIPTAAIVDREHRLRYWSPGDLHAPTMADVRLVLE